MVGLGPNLEESIRSQRQDHLVNLERMRDREISVHTTHTSRSQSRSRSHLSYEKNTKVDTTEDCRTLWNQLEQLVRDGRLQQFLYRPNG